MPAYAIPTLSNPMPTLSNPIPTYAINPMPTYAIKSNAHIRHPIQCRHMLSNPMPTCATQSRASPYIHHQLPYRVSRWCCICCSSASIGLAFSMRMRSTSASAVMRVSSGVGCGRCAQKQALILGYRESTRPGGAYMSVDRKICRYTTSIATYWGSIPNTQRGRI